MHLLLWQLLSSALLSHCEVEPSAYNSGAFGLRTASPTSIQIAASFRYKHIVVGTEALGITLPICRTYRANGTGNDRTGLDMTC